MVIVIIVMVAVVVLSGGDVSQRNPGSRALAQMRNPINLSNESQTALLCITFAVAEKRPRTQCLTAPLYRHAVRSSTPSRSAFNGEALMRQVLVWCMAAIVLVVVGSQTPTHKAIHKDRASRSLSVIPTMIALVGVSRTPAMMRAWYRMRCPAWAFPCSK